MPDPAVGNNGAAGRAFRSNRGHILVALGVGMAAGQVAAWNNPRAAVLLGHAVQHEQNVRAGRWRNHGRGIGQLLIVIEPGALH